jgi:predicted metal-dependent phosphotriesterase family hydrolase
VSARAGQVMTVRGPVEPSELGIVLAHDHLLCDSWKIVQDYAFVVDNEDLAGAEAEHFRTAGGGTICDPTNVGLGRDALALRRISERTGLHVVMGSAWYRERAYPPYVFEESAARLADRLATEIEDGVDATGSGRDSSARSAPSGSTCPLPRSACSARRHGLTGGPARRS